MNMKAEIRVMKLPEAGREEETDFPQETLEPTLLTP